MLKKTYQITKVIYNCGVIQKIIIVFFTVFVALGIRFGNLKLIETDPRILLQNQLLENSRSTQSAIDGCKSNNLLKLSGGDLGKASSPGVRARNAARNAARKANRTGNPGKSGTGNPGKSGTGNPGKSGYAEAWGSTPFKRSRPEAANRLAEQLQAGPVKGGNGLFGRFSAKPSPKPNNPGCAGGPRSITVLSQTKSSQQDSVREIIGHDGVKGELSDKSTNHLTTKHGHVLGINDPLPPQNSTNSKYKKIRTRINKENKEKFGDTVEQILKDTNTETYPDVSIRGIKGHGYRTENYGEAGFFVGIHTEGEFKGQIKKAQPISEQQLKILEEENRID